MDIRYGFGGTLSVGCVETNAALYLSGLIKEFSEAYPNVTYDLYNGTGSEILTRIDWGELELGLLLEPVEIANWFHVGRSSLHIIATHNLLTNALPHVENGLGYAVCVEGAYRIRPTETLCFIPFSPEWRTGHFLAWKKGKALSPAAERFVSFARDSINR